MTEELDQGAEITWTAENWATVVLMVAMAGVLWKKIAGIEPTAAGLDSLMLPRGSRRRSSAAAEPARAESTSKKHPRPPQQRIGLGDAIREARSR